MTIKIALDAGHGLRTSGKQTPDGIKEWTLNDKVRDKIVAMLSSYDCEFLFPDKNEGYTDESLSSRVSYYISMGANVLVSIHHNAFTGKWGNATGVETYTDKACTAADLELARLIQSKLAAYTGLKNRGVKKANWAVINQNKITAVLVEGGFMDSKHDYAIITSDAGQTAYARAVAEALIEFLDLRKKDSTSNTVVSTTPTSTTNTDFQVKFKEEMNVRIKAGVNHAKVTICKKNTVYTIKKTTKVGDVLWGYLKSGAGWVCIDDKYCSRVTVKANTKKSIDTIAKEVIAGKWGTGSARKKALTNAGYNYSAVQKRVNQLLK